MGNLKRLSKLTGIIASIGAINWGLYTFFDTDLVETVTSNESISNLIYGVIALSGVIYLGLRLCCACCTKSSCCSCGCSQCGSNSMNCQDNSCGKSCDKDKK